MGNYYSFSKQDIPKKNDIGLGLILVYLWFFYISVKIVNNLFNSKDEKKIKNKILDNIIGLESVKEEIRYYMDFINNKKKYKN